VRKVTHRRWIGTTILAIFLVQLAVILALGIPGGDVGAPEILVGLIVVLNCLFGLSMRITSEAGSLSISGFLVGIPTATFVASDLISVRFRRVYAQGYGVPRVLVLGLRAQSSAGDFQVPIYGWSHNRELFVRIAEMVSSSGIPVDAGTARMLTRISGINLHAK